MSLKIRILDRDDLQDVERIADQALFNSWSHAVFEDCFKVGYVGWVLENEQAEIVGFLVALIDAEECQVMNIGVDQRHYRHGYATQLLKHLMEHVKMTSVLRIILEVRASNTAAIRLYQSQHFSQLGIRKGYYPSLNGREDALIFCEDVKRIDPH